ncbi:MarR family winged helix-turn-helix transcriptional regulator [Breoghania sp. JC706]|uniref:MarR family winged helix-turn-helix transcriptional regulator n=1 Tax=Breoghania sp. JC706 TaxID=3117732 RepID=UPI00300BD2BF
MSDDLNCTCYRLRRADRRLSRLYEAALVDTGVTIVQFAVFAELERAGGMGISALAERLGTDRTTMTRTLDRMEALGWVAVERADDARLQRHVVSAAGRAVFRDAWRGWRRTETAIAKAMGGERLALLWQLLGEAEEAARAAQAADIHAAE